MKLWNGRQEPKDSLSFKIYLSSSALVRHSGQFLGGAPASTCQHGICPPSGAKLAEFDRRRVLAVGLAFR